MIDVIGRNYVGRVVNVPTDKPYAYIGIASVRTEDGLEAHLPTQADVFIHREDCKSPLRVGMELKFEVREDDRRGEGFYRAKYAEETAASSLDLVSKGGIELALQGYDGGRYIEHSSVLGTWCISAALAGQVKEKTLDGKTVRLLIMHGQDDGPHDFWYTERRQLLTLDETMMHFSFDKPGIHRLFALIVWADKEKDLVDRYLSRDGSRYKTTVISTEGTKILLEEKDEGKCRYGERNIHFFGSGYIQAELPQTLFAAPPRDWKWVNWMYETKPKDQCRYRWRRVFAYTFQPLVAIPIYYSFFSLGWLFRLLIVAILLSVGKRRINYEALRRFRYEVKWIWSNLGKSVFTLNIGKAEVSFLYPISPASLIVTAVLTAALDKLLGVQLLSSASAWLFVKIFILEMIIFALMSGLEIWLSGIDKEVREEARKAREEETKRQTLEVEVNRLICAATGPRKPEVRQMPITLRTIRFYGIAAKQKVCKNFVAG